MSTISGNYVGVHEWQGEPRRHILQPRCVFGNSVARRMEAVAFVRGSRTPLRRLGRVSGHHGMLKLRVF